MRAAVIFVGVVLACAWTTDVRAEAPRKEARERSVVVEGEKTKRALELPEDIESRIFFSDRPATTEGTRKRLGEELLERMLREREALVVERRKQGIARLRTFIREQKKSSPYMADALLRLAELQWEEARASYIEAYEAWQKVPKASRSPTPPTANISEPLRLYDRILKDYPRFERNDLVLYMKGYALVEAGRTNEALEAYRRIIQEHPKSRFLPDAHMAFAESYFLGSYDYKAALAEYEQVLKHPESELSDLALFKSAWCLWKLNRVTEAATRFRRVLDLGEATHRMSSERRRRLMELQDEALEYLIQVFTEDERNTAADLHRFLSQIGGERYAGKVLRRLSRTFFDQSRYDRAIEAYTMLLESEPSSPHAPQNQRQIAAAYDQMDDAAKTIEALGVLCTKYAPNSEWARHQGDPSVLERASRMAERAVRRQALRYHQRAQKEKSDAHFGYAASLYRIHVQRFADSPFNYEVTFYLGEILFHRLKQYQEAGEMYLAAARKNPKGELTQDALYNAIIAFEAVRVKELEGCTPEKGAADAACQETETDRKFSEAIALYIQLYPTDKEVPGILFRQGRMYFDRGIYDPAVRQFGQLLDSYPNSEYATTAGELVLESFNRAKDYGNIETWARRLKKAPAFQTGDAQRRLDALILQAVFKNGEQLAERGAHAEAAQAYLRAAREFPRDQRAPQAYYNAGLQFQQAGSLGEAAAAYDGLIEQHPGTEEGALGAWTAAEMYESIAQFRDAARYYEAYARSFPKAKRNADALYNATVLRLAAGDYARAIEDGQRFSRSHAGHETDDEVRFMVGRAQEQAGDLDDAARTYRTYASRGKDLDRKVEAQTRLAQVLLRKGDARGAARALAAAVKTGQRNAGKLEGGRYFAAQARFLQGDQILADFERITIAGDRKSLGRRLQQKSELLRKAAAAYGDVVDFKVAEWVTAALFKIGRSYELFAQSLNDAPIPDGLNEQEEQAYRDQLAMFVVPIEERALEAYEGGYRRAIELSVYNSWTQQLREGLTRLNDVEYPPLRELGSELSEGHPLTVPAPYDSLRRTGGADAKEGKGGKTENGARSSRRKRASGGRG